MARKRHKLIERSAIKLDFIPNGDTVKAATKREGVDGSTYFHKGLSPSTIPTHRSATRYYRKRFHLTLLSLHLQLFLKIFQLKCKTYRLLNKFCLQSSNAFTYHVEREPLSIGESVRQCPLLHAMRGSKLAAT